MLPLAPPHLRHVLGRLREVQQGLGLAPAADDPAARLADEVDSMGLVELVAVLAEDCGVRLGRPAGWLEQHAGIRQRHVWAGEDPLAAAAEAGRACLRDAGLLEEEVGALLVPSQAPPLLAGLAAALHHRLGLRPQTAALAVGGACTGFLAALWLARAWVAQVGPGLVLAGGAPS